jgi:hypothetical protein
VLPLRFVVEIICQKEQPLRREEASRHYRMVQVLMGRRYPQVPELVTVLPDFLVVHPKQLSQLLRQAMKMQLQMMQLTPHCLNRWVMPLRLLVEMNCQEEQTLRREEASRQ